MPRKKMCPTCGHAMSNVAMKRKVGTVMEEFKEGKLHSGSKKGPKVRKRKQAIAIALSEARRMKKKKSTSMKKKKRK